MDGRGGVSFFAKMKQAPLDAGADDRPGAAAGLFRGSVGGAAAAEIVAGPLQSPGLGLSAGRDQRGGER